MEDSLALLSIAIGVVIILFLTFISVNAAQSKSWLKTSGVLLNKGTRLHISKDIQANVVTWKSVHIDIEYEYEVEGKKYISKRATFSDMVNKPMSSLDSLINQYLTENSITVYYNPNKHSDSVLFPGVKIWNFTPMITGLAFIFGGLFFLIR